jgi:hypothetical protein|tara:strand:- start:216 stop:371 length:156 start_codon:yes stop_codon:yes gene_type:complete
MSLIGGGANTGGGGTTVINSYTINTVGFINTASILIKTQSVILSTIKRSFT